MCEISQSRALYIKKRGLDFILIFHARNYLEYIKLFLFLYCSNSSEGNLMCIVICDSSTELISRTTGAIQNSTSYLIHKYELSNSPFLAIWKVAVNKEIRINYSTIEITCFL